MLLESFSQAILRWLRVPPGASLRHTNSPGTSSAVAIEDNDYISTILDITVDDICIGEAPLSISYATTTPKTVKVKFKEICDEYNSIVKDVARDLLVYGVSIYDVDIDTKKGQMYLFPYLEPCDFYLTSKKEVIAYKQDERKQLKDKLIFINYNKRSLTTEDTIEGAKFKIVPTPMQLKNAERTISGLTSAENSVARYRALLKPVRYGNVDIGTAQGDVQKTTIDTISSAINCNSEDLGNGAPFTEFDDNLPILPNRKGLGKLEIGSDIPSANIKDLADVDYWLSKLNLIMRFPGTYMDFSKALSESAVSLIRGDLRYVKLVKSVQTKITKTLNDTIQDSKFKKYVPVFALTTLPTSEDDDVMEAMSSYLDVLKDVEDFIVGSGEDSKEVMLHRLRMLQDLFAASTNSPTLQRWFEDIQVYIEQRMSGNQEEESDEDIGQSDDEFFEGSSEGPSFEDFSSEEPSEPSSEGPSPDVEILEPQSNG